MTRARTPWWGHVLTGVILGGGFVGLVLSLAAGVRSSGVLGFAIASVLGIVLLARSAARHGT